MYVCRARVGRSGTISAFTLKWKPYLSHGKSKIGGGIADSESIVSANHQGGAYLHEVVRQHLGSEPRSGLLGDPNAAVRNLFRGTILDCLQGTTLIQNDHQARNCIIQLSSALEMVATNEKRVFGDRAGTHTGAGVFSTRKRHSASVTVGTGGARVLSLSGRTIRELREQDPLPPDAILSALEEMLLDSLTQERDERACERPLAAAV